uniref:Transmembrane protein 101 n=1 Tax=Nothoprocta perdicaria TaxID=30464 RepID=A0A8C6ZHK3_NOTPE
MLGEAVGSQGGAGGALGGTGGHWGPDIPVPYLYVDLGAAVLCASFMSFGVKRRWFALGAALQLAVATYAAHVGGHAHYGDWLKVRMYSRTVAIIGGFLILASGAGELYRQKPRSRSLQSTGQVFLGIYLICQVWHGGDGDTRCLVGWGGPGKGDRSPWEDEEGPCREMSPWGSLAGDVPLGSCGALWGPLRFCVPLGTWGSLG